MSVFPDLNSKSAAHYVKAKDILPMGGSRSLLYMDPYPVVAKSASGCRITDVDGVERIDFVNNYTTLLLGHCHPAVVDAVQRQAAQGMCWAMPDESEYALAELLCSRVPSIEQIRFANSGTEAVMTAIKAARAYTEKPKIAKIEGAYHGSYDYAEVSLASDPQNWGQGDPAPVAYSRGVPRGVLDDVVVLPFNQVAESRRILDAHADELAGVLFDAIPSKIGCIPADPEYTAMLRDFTRETDTVFILDEVLTFRAGMAGVQGAYGIDPDITTLGKVIGGGLPIGAIGGRKKFMEVFDQRRGTPGIAHTGTFNANPLSMVAGLAGMNALQQDSFDHLNSLGQYTRDTLAEAFRIAGIEGQVTGDNSLFYIQLGHDDIVDYRSAYPAHSGERAEIVGQLYRHLLNQGSIISPWGVGCLSTPMERADIDVLAEGLLSGLRALSSGTLKVA
jgi:glutamate-1-semialdehyde 2,1-aminomutase